MTAGGWKAIKSVFRYGIKIGPIQLWQTLHSKNACKACAFGTGGQLGGLHNEAKQGIEICNKNIQAHLSDIRPGIPLHSFFEHSIQALSDLKGKSLEDLGRLTTPLYKKKGDTHYTPIPYEQALAICIDRLKACPPHKSFFYASGRSSNEAAFLMQLMARLYGTNNINNCSYYCHQASGVALQHCLGTSTATVEYADLQKADLVFVMSANPASNHPRFVKTLIQLRRRGGQVIVINPVKEPGLIRFAAPSDWRSMLKGGEKIASEYIQPHLGGDLAFIQGVAKAVLELNTADADFIQHFTAQFSEYRHQLQALNWLDIVAQSGVEKTQIQQIAQLYSRAKACIFTWSMGITHHVHGVQSIQAIASLALLRGMVGKPGAGLLPLRGHSNIQGVGSMGFTPELKKAIQTAFTHKLGAVLPSQPGLDTMACMQAAHQHQMDVAVMLGGNLLAANPDTQFARDALNNIPFKLFINPTLNISHVQGVDQEVMILPPKARDEEIQATTQESMFNFVRLSDGGIKRFPQLRSEVDMICEVGKGIVNPNILDFLIFKQHNKIRQWIAETVPGFAHLGDLDRHKKEFHIEGRILHQPVFNTQDGKAQFCCHLLPHKTPSDFVLTSVRSEGQFNSIIYHEFDSYRDQTERWVLMMNPDDMAEQGWRTDQRIDVVTDTGRMEGLKLKPFDIRRGNLMTYYPEANILIPRGLDPLSKTPGFKSVSVRVQMPS